MALTRFSTSEKSTGLAPPRTGADINKRVTAVRYETGNLLDRAAAKSSPRQEGGNAITLVRGSSLLNRQLLVMRSLVTAGVVKTW
ncbi:MAG: hypothetical protein IMY87_01170 [Chloroflexi bacterium]|nr:hypothetical protein [Chloroflexota bacterium]